MMIKNICWNVLVWIASNEYLFFSLLWAAGAIHSWQWFLQVIVRFREGLTKRGLLFQHKVTIVFKVIREISSSQNWQDEGKGSDLADLVNMREEVDYGVQDIKGNMCDQGDQFCMEAINSCYQIKKAFRHHAFLQIISSKNCHSLKSV